MPSALCGLGKVVWSAYKSKKWIEMLPLLLVQLNTVLIWTCTIWLMILEYYYYDTPGYYIRGNVFRKSALNFFLKFILFLEPVTIFLYTWTFLSTLERGAKNTYVKEGYKWFARLTGVTIPVIYLGLFAALCISEGN